MWHIYVKKNVTEGRGPGSVFYVDGGRCVKFVMHITITGPSTSAATMATTGPNTAGLSPAPPFGWPAGLP